MCDSESLNGVNRIYIQSRECVCVVKCMGIVFVSISIYPHLIEQKKEELSQRK